MMGTHEPQKDLFAYHIDLDRRVRADHPLRRVAEKVDFRFVREEVKHLYGYNGNESVPPETVLKMMFLLFFDNVASERELMRIIAERLDYMWFLGYGLNDEIPDHSVLSKARRRWGPEVFEQLFIRVVWQCVQAGLVDGKKIHLDGSLVDADASNNAIVKGPPELMAALKATYADEANKLEEREPGHQGSPYYKAVNEGLLNQTDPDAPVVSKPGKGRRARYKNHRAVDDAYGVITAVETTPGDVEENAKLMGLVKAHEANTEAAVETVVADRQYGTAENFVQCQQRGIRAHMADFKASVKGTGTRAGIFDEEQFLYDPNTDTFTCPAGEVLHRRKHKKTKQAYEYAAAASVCRTCAFRDQCTKAKNGAARTIKRHYHQELIDAGREQAHSLEAKRDRIKRRWLMEGSFADATKQHGFKRARWRRLWRQQVQDYLIATAQNIRTLVRYGSEGGRVQSAHAIAGLSVVFRAGNALDKLIRGREQSPEHLVNEIAFYLN